MFSKFLIHLFCIPLLIGCAQAWVIRQDAGGGIIGYKRVNSQEKFQQKVVPLIWCSNYTTVSDELFSRDYQYQGYQNVTTNGSGTITPVYNPAGVARYNSSYTTQVPVTRTGTAYWREFTYRCN